MRANLRTAIVVSVAAIMGAACSTRQTDSTDPTGDLVGAGTLDGMWAHTAIGPVYREFMTLAQSGTSVTGTGTYAIEAGRAGPTTIAGTLSGKRLTLTITRDYGQVETFAGTITDATHLTGTLTIDGFSQPFGFVKGEK
jgi:hypothetical protein